MSPSSSSSSQTSPSLGPPTHERHWPLDLPGGLPFDRYEHRRLTARDLLVHRIMSKILSPSPDLARVLKTRRKHRGIANLAKYSWIYLALQWNGTAPCHNFGPLKQQDHCLARDVEVLRKMLVTRSHTEQIFEAYDASGPSEVDPGLLDPLSWRKPSRAKLATDKAPAVPTVEEEVLDLIRRHYLEMDDPRTRLWLQSIQPTQPSSYNTLSKKPSKFGTRSHTTQKRRHLDGKNAREDYKLWYDEDTALLKVLQAQTRTANEHRLYEGGASLPVFRRPLLSSNAQRKQFLHMATRLSKDESFEKSYTAQRVLEETFTWPGPPAPKPVLHVPSWYSWRQMKHFFSIDCHLRSVPAFDFASSRTGRGLDRDGIWSTARWQGDDGPRGRTKRRGRRRATSEPPHGTFTAARLPVSFNRTREILIFPKMSLATMDRRARRRSLSRTRIAEMFDWDAVLETPLEETDELIMGQSKASSHRQITDIERIYRHLEKQRLDSRYQGLGPQFPRYENGHITMVDAIAAIWTRRPFPKKHVDFWPQWWLQDDGLAEALIRLRPVKAPRAACSNCTSGDHATDRCKLPCGYCGAPSQYVRSFFLRFGKYFRPHDRDAPDEDGPSQATKHDNPHTASTCPVAKQNRCKCVPFPQFHVAAKCPVLCSRDCGNHGHPPGHFKHKNAMSCGTRCCMCGMKGHSGMKCKLRRCRCGGEHLGQDCGWHPECRADGCDRFLCGVHCQLCGCDRAQLEQGAVLVGGQCPSCLARGAAMAPKPVLVADSVESTDVVEAARGPADDGPAAESGRRRRRRRNKPKQRPTEPKEPQAPPEQKPWYAPLEPRTRPVATSKSGKKGAWSRAETDLPVGIGGCR